MNRLLALLVAVIALIETGGCAKQKPPEPIREYKIEGDILKVNPGDQAATIKHKAIEGWMGAMTMEYPIKTKEDLARLHVGDHITGKVYVQGEEYSVGDIHATHPANQP